MEKTNIRAFATRAKKWGHAKQAQKSDILTTRGFNPCGIGLREMSHWATSKEK